jgi:hypothetical protein
VTYHCGSWMPSWGYMEEAVVGNEVTEVNGQSHKVERSRPTFQRLGRTLDMVIQEQRKPHWNFEGKLNIFSPTINILYLLTILTSSIVWTLLPGSIQSPKSRFK